MVKLGITISSLKLDNPLILASGLMDEDAGSMERIFNNGAGAIVTKSIGLKPRKGYPNPTVIELEHGILNAIGLPNPGIENFKDEIIKLKKINIPVIGSIFGTDSEEFVTLAEKMQNYGVDALELNMSCPHAKGYGLEIGCDPDLVKEITLNVKKSTNIPVFVKISPNLANIVEIAKSAEEGNADGIVAINTLKAMKIDIEMQMPVLSNKIGGYSGNAIKPIGIRCVYEISKNIDIPVIGVGGITTGIDAIEYFMAGASSVQVGSAIYQRGLDVFKKICDEIKIWMENHRYNNISDLVGVAHK
ncbi:MAG: dihydroorotate dehydrogenase [Thermoplasmatales archaeon]|nr:MAG: dihydroorotate dehydrogenase [Thermoplasmatales archaeon]